MFSASDLYYSQGIRMELALPWLRKNPVNRLLPKLPHGHNEEFGISVNQQCFTPVIITDDYIRYGDHPFAAALFLGMHRVSYHAEKKLRLTSELDLGGIGPCALCEQTQEAIHEALDNVYPHGWRYQVSSDAVINFLVRLEKRIPFSPFADLALNAQAQLGTLYTNAGGGFGIRIGWLPTYTNVPHDERLRAWLYARGEAYAIGYNAMMQGGMFNRSSAYTIPASDISRGVLYGNSGAVVAWKRIQLEFSYTWITPEFHGGMNHSWGRCAIAAWF